MSQRTAERRTIATPQRFVDLGMRDDEGLALRAAHYVFAIEGQEFYRFPVRNSDRAGERVHPDKKVELKMYFPLLAVGSLPQAGRARKAVRAASLEEIAGAAGWRAPSTVHRNRIRARLTKKTPKRFGGANRYELAIPEGSERPEQLDASAYWNPSLAQLREHFAIGGAAQLRADTEKRGSKCVQHPEGQGEALRLSPLGFRGDLDDLSGYFYVQPWVWHPLNPVRTSARIVMSYLNARGFLQRQDGKLVTHIQISPLTIGKAVSMRPETVREALKQWETQNIISVFCPPARKLKDKEGWEQEPLIITYLPATRLTRELREVERKRILAASATMRRHSYWMKCGQELQRTIFERLWHATRNDWPLQSFWHELNQFLQSQQIPGDVISSLLPRPPR